MGASTERRLTEEAALLPHPRGAHGITALRQRRASARARQTHKTPRTRRQPKRAAVREPTTKRHCFNEQTGRANPHRQVRAEGEILPSKAYRLKHARPHAQDQGRAAARVIQTHPWWPSSERVLALSASRVKDSSERDTSYSERAPALRASRVHDSSECEPSSPDDESQGFPSKAA